MAKIKSYKSFCQTDAMQNTKPADNRSFVSNSRFGLVSCVHVHENDDVDAFSNASNQLFPGG
jgi:hypothetical protein